MHVYGAYARVSGAFWSDVTVAGDGITPGATLIKMQRTMRGSFAIRTIHIHTLAILGDR